jgi:hypothetical protein
MSMRINTPKNDDASLIEAVWRAIIRSDSGGGVHQLKPEMMPSTERVHRKAR